jgi:hypothetical protein
VRVARYIRASAAPWIRTVVPTWVIGAASSVIRRFAIQVEADTVWQPWRRWMGDGGGCLGDGHAWVLSASIAAWREHASPHIGTRTLQGLPDEEARRPQVGA